MKFIVIYRDCSNNNIYFEQLDTHAAVIRYINEVVKNPYDFLELVKLIYGVVIETEDFN